MALGTLALDTFNYLIVSIFVCVVGAVICEWIPKTNEWKYAYKFILLGFSTIVNWYIGLMLFTQSIINLNNGSNAQNAEFGLILCTIAVFLTGAFVLNLYDFYTNTQLARAVDLL